MASGCGDCHSPKAFSAAGPEPDVKRLLSGYAMGTQIPDIPKGILGPEQ
jgi:hypothetical protein